MSGNLGIFHSTHLEPLFPLSSVTSLRSKSTTDIPMESPGYQDDGQNLGGPDVSRPSRPPNGARSKESVEKWQEVGPLSSQPLPFLIM